MNLRETQTLTLGSNNRRVQLEETDITEVGVESSSVGGIVSLHANLERGGRAGMENSVGNRRPNGGRVGFDTIEVHSKSTLGSIVSERDIDPATQGDRRSRENLHKVPLGAFNVATEKAAKGKV